MSLSSGPASGSKRTWPVDRLLRGSELADAEMLAAQDIVLEREVLEFIKESDRQRLAEAEAEARRGRRLRMARAVTLALVAVAFVAFVQLLRTDAERNYADRLAAAWRVSALASQRLDEEFDLGLLLSVSARHAAASLRPEDVLESLSTLASGAAANPRLQRYIHSHEGIVTAVAFLPRGRKEFEGRTLFASANARGRVDVWDGDTGRIVQVVSEGGPWISALAFSPEGQWLAAGGCREPRESVEGNEGRFPEDCAGLVRVWDLRAGSAPRGRWPVSGRVVRTLAFDPSPDGDRMAAGSQDGSIYVWDASTWQLLESFVHEGAPAFPRGIAYLPDGKTLAAGYSDGKVRLWDTATWSVTGELDGGSKAVETVAVSPDGGWLASGGWDAVVRNLEDTIRGPPLCCARGARPRSAGAGLQRR